jgi:hypothetical protein
MFRNRVVVGRKLQIRVFVAGFEDLGNLQWVQRQRQSADSPEYIRYNMFALFALDLRIFVGGGAIPIFSVC